MKLKPKPIRKFEPIVRTDKRWAIAKGGRGSGKSWSMAELMVIKTVSDGKSRLCTRPVQKSIRDSSHKLIAGAIKRLNVEHLFEVKRDYIVFIETGAEFIFTGMRDVKSMEGVQDVWIEEAQDATEEMLQDLAPTIRQEGSQIYATYNPKNDDDPINIRATDPAFDSTRTVVHMNWSDNPHFPEVLNDERLTMKAFNTDLYNHIWEGDTLKVIEGALIKSSYFNYYSKLPTIVRSTIIVDTATKAKEQHDYTVFIFAGLGSDGRIYIMDVLRGKWESVERETQAMAFLNKHKKRNLYGIGANSMKIEDAASGTDLIQRMRAKNKPVNGITRKRSASGFEAKFGRLMDVFVHISGADNQPGIICLPECAINYHDTPVTNAAWVSDFIDEAQRFTADDSHDFDDQVDCLIDVVAELAPNGKGNLGYLMG